MLAAPFTPHQARRYFLQSQAENCGIGDMVIDGGVVKVAAHDLQACDNDPYRAVCRLRNTLKRTGITSNFTLYLEIKSEQLTIVYSILAWLTEFTFPWFITWGSSSRFVRYDSQSIWVSNSSNNKATIAGHVKAYLEQTGLDYRI
jgi:hypothetical protein